MTIFNMSKFKHTCDTNCKNYPLIMHVIVFISFHKRTISKSHLSEIYQCRCVLGVIVSECHCLSVQGSAGIFDLM